MAENLYGGTLTLENGYGRILNDFKNQMNRAGNILNDFNNSNKKSANETSRSWNSAFSSMNTSLNKFSNNTLSTIAKITAGWLSVKGAIGGVKEILKSGSEFQNASMFLQSAYGEQLGKEKFKFATKFANETPFGESEVANALARSKMLGLKDDEKSFSMYSDLGSLAKLTGTGDLSSAIDAVSDMKNGEWERLQTILGIKRTSLEDYANSKGMEKFTNKQGQVTNQDALMKAFESYLGDKGILGMTEKYANTLSGRLNTLGGNFTKMLAELGGIKDDGTLETGELFDQAGKGLERLINSVNNFAKSPSFDKLKDGLGKVGNAIISLIDYATTHPQAISNLLKFGGALIGLKVVTGLVSPIFKFADGVVNLKSKISTFVDFLNKTSLNQKNNTSNTSKNSAGKLLTSSNFSKVNSKAAKAGVVLGATASLVNNDGLIHKIGNNVNPMNWFNSATGKDQEDYISNILGYTSKASTWIGNKTGLYNDKEANLMYQGADQYMKNASDYLNNKTDIKPSLADVGQNVVINIDKIEKEADADSLLMKIVNILNKNKTRNAVTYP